MISLEIARSRNGSPEQTEGSLLKLLKEGKLEPTLSYIFYYASFSS
jgi:hypothetical protein